MDLAKLNATDPRVEWLLFTINVFSGQTFTNVKRYEKERKRQGKEKGEREGKEEGGVNFF